MYDHLTFTAKMNDRRIAALNEVAGISGYVAGICSSAKAGIEEYDLCEVLAEVERRLDAAVESSHRPQLASLVTPSEDGVDGWIEEATSWAYNVAVVPGAPLDSDNPAGAVVVEHVSLNETTPYVVADFPGLAKGVSAIPYVLCTVCGDSEAVGDAEAHEADATSGMPYPSVFDDVCVDCLPDAFEGWEADQWAQLAEDRAADKLRGVVMPAYLSDVPHEIIDHVALGALLHHHRLASSQTSTRTVRLRYGPQHGKLLSVPHDRLSINVIALPPTKDRLLAPPPLSPTEKSYDVVRYVPTADFTIPELHEVWVPDTHPSLNKRGPS